MQARVQLDVAVRDEFVRSYVLAIWLPKPVNLGKSLLGNDIASGIINCVLAHEFAGSSSERR
jgi:hypothetical protein